MYSRRISKKSLSLISAALVVLLVLPLFLPRFYIYLLGVIFVAGLLATSLNMVLGFGARISFTMASSMVLAPIQPPW